MDGIQGIEDITVPVEQRIARAIRQLERSRRRFLERKLSELSLPGDMHLYLLVVSRKPGLSQDDICRDLRVDKGNAAKVIQKLEALGYLKKSVSEKDRRQHELRLTPAGTEAVKDIRRELKVWREEVTDGLSETEEEALLAGLFHMLRRSLELAESEG